MKTYILHFEDELVAENILKPALIILKPKDQSYFCDGIRL